MWRPRGAREFLVDGVLMLVLMLRCSPGGPVGDRLKVMKLAFLATYDMFRRRAKGFSYSFYRYQYGPFTSEVYETWQDLSSAGLMELSPQPQGQIGLTAAGRDFAEAFAAEVLTRGENSQFDQILSGVADSYGADSTTELLRKVYGMQVRPLGWEDFTTIGATPEGLYLTKRIEVAEARAILQVDDSWLHRFDAVRQEAAAAVSGVPFLHTERTLQEIAAALEAEHRGEGTPVTISEVRRTYGLE